MSSSSSPRETIQISLGPSANAITAHLLNLQGLAATSTSSFDNVYCDPNTTHYVKGGSHRGSGTLVPRVLMIDAATHQVPATPIGKGATSHDSSIVNQPHTTDSSLSAFYTGSCWNGQIQVLGDEALSATTTAAWNNGHHHPGNASQSTSPFWKSASAMAYSSHSRYHRTSSSETDHPGHQYRADPNNSRHVVWEEDGEEEEEEEDPYERTRRQEQSERKWKTETAVVLGQELDRQVAGELQQGVEEGKEAEESSSHEFHFNHWTDIWMPPRDEKSKVVLPFSSQSQLVPHWDVTYQNDGSNGSSTTPFLQEWKEDTLFENVRHMLESCDYGIQGVSIATEGHGIYASLATYLLEELKQECKSAGRLVYHVTNEKTNPAENAAEDLSATNHSGTVGGASSPPSSLSWQEAQVNRIRKQVSSGLALYDFTEKAHAVLPLQLACGTNGSAAASSLSWFRATAQIAMALEACTLPFRFNGNNMAAAGRTPTYQMGLQNAPFLAQGNSDTSWGSTATRLTFSEYLQVLQPSSSHSMLELDMLSPKIDGDKRMITNQKLYDTIQEGTSVERDQRTRHTRGYSYHSRPREVPPGTWLRDSRPDSSGTSGGLLSSLSYNTSQKYSDVNLDRSVHHHFALSTSVRPVLSPSNDGNDGITMSNYLTCLVQGMGIQYRPERSMATVLNQSLGQMTFGGEGGGGNYGAGIYWKYIMPQVDSPVVAVLGNTTRAYTSLNGIATDMKAAMRTSRFRGLYNRDVLNGVLPEMEDCEEALEACWNKRDVYQPPQGSGIGAEEDY